MFYNENFERTILSSVIYDPSMLSEISDHLRPHHFFLANNQEIYTAMIELAKSDKPIDESFIDRQTGRKLQGAIAEIMAQNPAANIMPYITDMVEMWAKREINRLSMVIKQSVDSDKSSEIMIGEIQRHIEMIEFAEDTRAKSFSDLKATYLSNPPAPVYATGVSFIDKALNGGFEMGQLVLVSGDPEAGKTILSMQILKNVSEAHPAVLFAFEFTTTSLVKLQMATEGKNYENKNLMIIDDGYDILDIEREIKLWRKKGARFFVIDSQMRIENISNSGTMEERESEKFSKLAKLAHKLDVLIMCIIQNSKADAAASVISPMGSKKGAHEASIIMHIKRLKDDEAGGKKERRELIFSKNKQTGVHFKGEIGFDPVGKKFTRHYEKGEADTKEYDGHKRVKVEHQDKSGKKTGESEYAPLNDTMEMVSMFGDD